MMYLCWMVSIYNINPFHDVFCVALHSATFFSLKRNVKKLQNSKNNDMMYLCWMTSICQHHSFLVISASRFITWRFLFFLKKRKKFANRKKQWYDVFMLNRRSLSAATRRVNDAWDKFCWPTLPSMVLKTYISVKNVAFHNVTFFVF